MSHEALIDTIAEVPAERVFVARALEPTLRRRVVEAWDATELPFVRGRTVMPPGLGDRDLVVAGHPNHLGVFDVSAGSWLAVTGRWSSLREPVGAVASVAVQPPADRREAEAALATAEAFARRVRQLRGATVAFPVESPVVVVLLDRDPVPVAVMAPGWSPLEDFFELPGGLRVEVRDGDADRYASTLEGAMSEEP